MNKQVTWTVVALAVSGLLSGCASTPGAKPEDMSAKAHEEEAAKEAEMAQELAAKAASAEQAGIGLSAHASPADAAELQAERHLEHAKDHLAAAKALGNAEEEACKTLPAGVRESCPLLGPDVTTEPTTNGAMIVGPTVIELTTTDEANVRELQERVAAQIGD